MWTNSRSKGSRSGPDAGRKRSMTGALPGLPGRLKGLDDRIERAADFLGPRCAEVGIVGHGSLPGEPRRFRRDATHSLRRSQLSSLEAVLKRNQPIANFSSRPNAVRKISKKIVAARVVFLICRG